jgi:hypothetical protein
MTLFEQGLWQLIVCFSVLVVGAITFFVTGYRGFSREECFQCRREMGYNFNEEFVRSAPNADYDIYIRYRVCQSCQTRSQIREIKKPKKRQE